MACEMLGLDTVRVDCGEIYDESLLDDRLRGMLDRWSTLSRRVTSDLYTRQSIASVIIAWEATKPEALCDAVNSDMFRRSPRGRNAELASETAPVCRGLR